MRYPDSDDRSCFLSMAGAGRCRTHILSSALGNLISVTIFARYDPPYRRAPTVCNVGIPHHGSALHSYQIEITPSRKTTPQAATVLQSWVLRGHVREMRLVRDLPRYLLLYHSSDAININARP